MAGLKAPALKKTRQMQAMAPFDGGTMKFALVRETCASNDSVEQGKTRYKYFGQRMSVANRHGMGAVETPSFYYRKHGRASSATEYEAATRAAFSAVSRQAHADVKDLSLYPKIIAKWSGGIPVAGANPQGYTYFGFVFCARWNDYEAGEGQFTPGNTFWA